MLKAEELAALNFLQRDHPRPRSLVWINRGTDQPLRPTTIEMLLRTLFRPATSPSVRKLHRTAGLRICFASERDRDVFSRLFVRACDLQSKHQSTNLIAVFEKPEMAERTHRELIEAGLASRSISMLWRAGQFIRARHDSPAGHSRTSVAAASAGGGLAGAIFGLTLLAVPGFGLIAAGGAAATHALAAIGAVGGAFGATGGAIARMLSDFDVTDRDIPYYEMAIREGKVFVSVDPSGIVTPIEAIQAILTRNGGTLTAE